MESAGLEPCPALAYSVVLAIGSVGESFQKVERARRLPNGEQRGVAVVGVAVADTVSLGATPSDYLGAVRDARQPKPNGGIHLKQSFRKRICDCKRIGFVRHGALLLW